LIRGILQYAQRVGPWHISVEPCHHPDEASLAAHRQRDGVIASVSTPDWAQRLTELRAPVVNVSAAEGVGDTFPRVANDGEASANAAIQHFLNRGFAHLGYVCPPETHATSDQRACIESILSREGVESYFYQREEAATTGPRDLQEGLRRWVVGLPKPVGIFTWNADEGRTLIDACRVGGVLVPHEVAVLGGVYDDIVSDACFPSLSGVAVAAERIGWHAAQTLDRLMNGRGEDADPTPPTVIPPHGVVEKASTDTIALKDRQMVRALHFLREHASEPIRVRDLLREVPMARRSLERKFLHFLGRTPLQELRRLRIAKARTLLAETDLPVQEIAESCGYATYNYLHHVFKKFTGLTPTAYRKQRRGP